MTSSHILMWEISEPCSAERWHEVRAGTKQASGLTVGCEKGANELLTDNSAGLRSHALVDSSAQT